MLSRPGRRLCAARSGLTGSYCVLRLFDHLLSMSQTARLCRVIKNFKSLAFKGHGPLSIPYVGVMIRSLTSVRSKTLFGHATNNCQFASQIVRGMSLYIVMESSAILPQMGVGYRLGCPFNALTRTGTRPETRPERVGSGQGIDFIDRVFSGRVYQHLKIRVFFGSIPEKVDETRS